MYIAQQAYFHNMPLALATAASWDDYVQLNKDQGSALYWWLPDPSFALDGPRIVQFPPEDPAEHARGIYSTMNPSMKLLTIVAAGLEDADSRVYALANDFRLSDSNVADILKQVAAGQSTWQSACDWLKANPNTWEEWVLDKTVCSNGKGMVDWQKEFVTLREDAVDCAICPAGRASMKMGASRVCTLCPEGSFQSTFGTTECTLCEPGTLSSTKGASQCEQCGLGMYASEPGSSSCEACGGGEEMWTTSQEVQGEEILILGAASESFCSCRAGSFLWEGKCETCMEGSSCSGGQLRLLPGYYSSVEVPGSVYQCEEGRCPGGLPGTCAAGRDPQSVACSLCASGQRPAGEGPCEACAGADYLLLALVALAVLAGVALLHVGLMKETARAGALVVVGSSLTQLVTMLQMLAVMGRFNIDWRDPLHSVLLLLEVMSFDPNMLSIGCVANVTPVSLFVFQVLFIPLLTSIAILVHLSYLLLTRSRTLQAKHLLRTVGTMFLMFFILLFSMLLSPFQCSYHPNGLATLHDYGSVFCNGQGEHLQMFIIGGFACLMPITFTALCTWILIWEVPRRLARSDAKFLESCSFLVKRFRPGAEISAVLFLMRNTTVVLTLVVYSTSGQLMLFSMILYLNLFLVAYYKPWRFPVCNLLEGALVSGMLLILNIGAMAVKETNEMMFSMALGVFLGFMGLAILGAIGFGVLKHLQQKYRKLFRFFLCHQKAAAGCLARLLKMELEQRLVGSKTFIDCDDLNDLTRLFSYVAQDTETFLIMGSPDILTRKWCVGEMVTARQNGVHTTLLAWPGFVTPDDDFIESYASLVPDIRELTRYGIGLTDVEETLVWLGEVDTKGLPDFITPQSISATIGSLTDKTSSRTLCSIWMGCPKELTMSRVAEKQ